MDYQKLFLQRWKELENEIELEKEDGETSFLEKDIFFKFFTSPELLVGYYVWRESGNLEYAYELFMDLDDEKSSAAPTQIVFWMIMQNTWMLNMSVLQTEPAAMLSITSLRGLSRNNVVLHRFIGPKRIWKGKCYA